MIVHNKFLNHMSMRRMLSPTALMTALMVSPERPLRKLRPSVNGGAKRDHCGGVKWDHLAAAGLSP